MDNETGIPARPKVVSLFAPAEEPPEAAAPRESVIKLLEALLEGAKAGDIQAVAVAYMDDQKECSYDVVGMLASFGMVGAVTCMQVTLASIAAASETGG